MFAMMDFVFIGLSVVLTAMTLGFMALCNKA